MSVIKGLVGFSALCALALVIYVSQGLAVFARSDNPDYLVEDNADLLGETAVRDIYDYHSMLLDRFDIDYRVITLNGQEDLNLYAAEMFKQKDIGGESKQHRGLLLLIDAENDQVRLEVSGNLESVYTDAFVAYIEQRQMVPFFNEGKVAAGIFATGELIRIRAGDAEKGDEFDVTALRGSFGGGAATQAGIDAGHDDTFEAGREDVPAAGTPKESLERYFTALAKRNGRGDLDVFTPESREFMMGLTRTAAQMDNVVKRYRNCEVEHVTYNDDRTRAVLFHSLKNRECDPFLFEKGTDGKWRLDLKALGSGLRHTYGNIWYVDFDSQESSGFWKYNFGFNHVYFRRPEGEKFDHQGIPYYRRFGLHINHVYEGSVIEKVHGEDVFLSKAGLREGDVILEWEGVKYPHSVYLSRRMKAVRPGLDIRMVVRREDTVFSKIVKAPPHPSPGELRFGVTVRSPGPPIPYVHYVEPGSQADKLGLQAGDHITRWQDVDSPSTVYVYRSLRELQKQANQQVSVEVLRDEAKVSLTGQVGPRRVMGKVH